MDRVHALNGTLVVDSPAGGGTSLTVRLPLGDTPDRPLPPGIDMTT
jgi:signal transduction histidine kinase